MSKQEETPEQKERPMVERLLALSDEITAPESSASGSAVRQRARELAAKFMDDGSPSGPDRWRTVSFEEVEELIAGVLTAIEGQLAALREERDALHAQFKSVGIMPYLDRMKELADKRDEAVKERDEARAALAAAQQACGALRKALERIVDWADCECKHDSKDCCENIPVHCPSCIAAVALAAAAAPAPEEKQ